MKHLLTITTIAFALLPAVAHAQHYAFDTNDTPIFINIAPDGSVTGRSPNSNPARVSTFYGHLTSSGTVEGTWVQQISNSMCTRPRMGSYAWGHFIIANIGTPSPYGAFGYCDARPNHSWDLRPRY